MRNPDPGYRHEGANGILLPWYGLGRLDLIWKIDEEAAYQNAPWNISTLWERRMMVLSWE